MPSPFRYAPCEVCCGCRPCKGGPKPAAIKLEVSGFVGADVEQLNGTWHLQEDKARPRKFDVATVLSLYHLLDVDHGRDWVYCAYYYDLSIDYTGGHHHLLSELCSSGDPCESCDHCDGVVDSGACIPFCDAWDAKTDLENGMGTVGRYTGWQFFVAYNRKTKQTWQVLRVAGESYGDSRFNPVNHWVFAAERETADLPDCSSMYSVTFEPKEWRIGHITQTGVNGTNDCYFFPRRAGYVMHWHEIHLCTVYDGCAWDSCGATDTCHQECSSGDPADPCNITATLTKEDAPAP